MTVPVFTPPVAPSPGTTTKPKANLLVATFGDGYKQVTRGSTRHIRRTISLNWETLTPDQATEIASFFETRAGFEPFYYTPSDETIPIKWTVTNWEDKRKKGGLRSLSADFEQSFLPD